VRVLFITNGSSPKPSVRTFIKRNLPNLSDRLKSAAALSLPSPVLRRILRGFSLEKRFPVGLGYLSAILKQEGIEVELVDRFVMPELWASRPIGEYDFVGVHVSTPYFTDALGIVARLEREGYAGPIAFGGPHVTLAPETVPPRVDFAVQGEAEYLILDLVAGNCPVGSLIRTPRIKDLDVLPRVDYELFMGSRAAYDLSTPYAPQKPFFNMHTSRSCPYACSFCAVRDIWGRLWTAHGAERVVDDITYLKSTYGAAGIYFREDFFATDAQRVVEICELLLKRGVSIVWACETRVDVAGDAALVALMARAGCRGFYIGAESGSGRMLEKYNKEATSDQTRRACQLARQNGINVAMSIIVADPEETIADRLATWRMVRECKPKVLQLSAFNGDHTGLAPEPYPTYAPRTVISPDLPNSTWGGQQDRRSPVGRFAPGLAN
jgi:radical SAM superfamily enzyme YgiQ (UPF0313 family)